ncbi:hypothetical protein BWD40_05115 [Sphingopyxis granuli]|nr:hypothetical protein BWD40_05115 [Sphingopyxis granuli]
MADARHHDLARVDVVRWDSHLQLTHQRSTRRARMCKRCPLFLCRPSGLQQLPDRGGRTYMMPGRTFLGMAASLSIL